MANGFGQNPLLSKESPFKAALKPQDDQGMSRSEFGKQRQPAPTPTPEPAPAPEAAPTPQITGGLTPQEKKLVMKWKEQGVPKEKAISLLAQVREKQQFQAGGAFAGLKLGAAMGETELTPETKQAFPDVAAAQEKVSEAFTPERIASSKIKDLPEDIKQDVLEKLEQAEQASASRATFLDVPSRIAGGVGGIFKDKEEQTVAEAFEAAKLPTERVVEKTSEGLSQAGQKLQQAGERITKFATGQAGEGVPAIADAAVGVISGLFAIPSALVSEVPAVSDVVEGAMGLIQSPFQAFEDRVVEGLKEKGFADDSEEIQKVRSVFEGTKAIAPVVAGAGVAKVAPKVASKVAPVVKKGVEKVKTKVIEKAPAVLEKAEAALKKGEVAQKTKFAEKLVTEKLTKKQIQKAVKEGKAVEGVFEAKPKLTAAEKATAKRLSELVPDLKEGLFKGENLKTNIGKISKKQTEVAQNIGRQLEQTKQAIDTTKVNTTLDAVKSQAKASGELSTITGNSVKIFEKMQEQFMDFFKKQEQTSKGLWEARKSYDQWVKTQKPTAFEGNVTAFKNANNAMRRAVNEMIQQTAPRAEFKTFLKDYSSLQSALENITTKVDASNLATLGRLTKSVKKITDAKLSLGTAGVGAGIIATGTAVPAAIAAGGLTGLYALFRAGVKGGRNLRSSAIKVVSKLKEQATKLQKAQRAKALEGIKEIEAIIPKLKEPEAPLPLKEGTTQNPFKQSVKTKAVLKKVFNKKRILEEGKIQKIKIDEEFIKIFVENKDKGVTTFGLKKDANIFKKSGLIKDLNKITEKDVSNFFE
jgi:hypothetical protein